MAFSFPFRFVTNEKCKTRRLLREQVNEIFSLKPIFPSAFPGKRVFISLSFTICYCSVVCFCLQISISMQSKDSVNGCYQRRVDLKIVGFLRLLEHFSQKLIFRVVFFSSSLSLSSSKTLETAAHKHIKIRIQLPHRTNSIRNITHIDESSCSMEINQQLNVRHPFALFILLSAFLPNHLPRLYSCL